MKEEIWKPVPNYEGIYEASTYGRVRSVERFTYNRRWDCYQKRKPVLLKPSVSPNGYRMVVFSVNNKRQAFSVHRIVARTFLPNPSGLPVVNHKDQNKLNNRVDNLEWCTQIYNYHYADADEKRAKSQSIAKKGKHYSPRTEFKKGNILQSCLHPVFCVEKNVLYRSMKEACQDCGVSRSTILKSYKTGQTIKGLTFKFTPEAFRGEQKTGF